MFNSADIRHVVKGYCMPRMQETVSYTKDIRPDVSHTRELLESTIVLRAVTTYIPRTPMAREQAEETNIKYLQRFLYGNVRDSIAQLCNEALSRNELCTADALQDILEELQDV